MTELRKYWKDKQREHRLNDMICPDCTNYDTEKYPSPCDYRKRWCTQKGFCVKFVKGKQT